MPFQGLQEVKLVVEVVETDLRSSAHHLLVTLLDFLLGGVPVDT